MSLQKEIKKGLTSLVDFANKTLKQDSEKDNFVIHIHCMIDKGTYHFIEPGKTVIKDLAQHSSDAATHYTRLATILKYNLNKGVDLTFQLEINGDIQAQIYRHFPPRTRSRDFGTLSY